MPGQVVLITGANNGIGLALTKALLADGYRVAAFDLSGEKLAGLTDQYTMNLRFYICDVTDADRVQAAVASVIAEWKEIDILVNNACLAFFCPYEDKPLADTRREFEVNYFGYLHTIDAVLPHMKSKRKGIIHNFSSSVGISGFPGIYGYVSTKGAIEGLTRTLSIEFQRYGITVNLVHPPLTRTKSAAPLGIPEQFMADPNDVGRKLAKKIGSTKSIVTPDIAASFGVFIARHFPEAMGRFLGARTEAAREHAGRG